MRILCRDCWLDIIGGEDTLPASMGRAPCSECGEMKPDCYEDGSEGDD